MRGPIEYNSTKGRKVKVSDEDVQVSELGMQCRL